MRTIPITFNFGLNISQINPLPLKLPEGLNPHTNFGLGYYITEFCTDAGWSRGWKWNEFGYNFGLGADYDILPGISIGFGFNRYSVFTGTNYTFGDWNFGLSYYWGEHEM